MNRNDIVIGKTLAFFLKEKKILKGDLAEKLDISNAMLTKILQGKNRLSFTRFLEVCEALNISPIVFINKMKKAKETFNIGISV